MGGNHATITITIAATLLAWIAWGLTIALVDPNASGWIGILVFSLTLFAAVGGSATVIGLSVRRHAPERARAIRIAIRQGVLTGLAVIVGIFLASRGLFSWVNMLFLIIALTLLELFWISLGARASGGDAMAGIASSRGSSQ